MSWLYDQISHSNCQPLTARKIYVLKSWANFLFYALNESSNDFKVFRNTFHYPPEQVVKECSPKYMYMYICIGGINIERFLLDL